MEKTGKYGFDMAVKETILIFWGVGEIIIAIINAIRALYIYKDGYLTAGGYNSMFSRRT